MSIESGSSTYAHNNSLAILITSDSPDDAKEKPSHEIYGDNSSPSSSASREDPSSSMEDKKKPQFHDLSSITLNPILEQSLGGEAQTCSGSARRNSFSSISRPTLKSELEKVEKTSRRVSDTAAKSKTIRLLKKSDDSGSSHGSLSPSPTFREQNKSDESKDRSPGRKTSRGGGQTKAFFHSGPEEAAFQKPFLAAARIKAKAKAMIPPRSAPAKKAPPENPAQDAILSQARHTGMSKTLETM